MNHFPNQFIAVSGKNKLKALNYLIHHKNNTGLNSIDKSPSPQLYGYIKIMN